MLGKLVAVAALGAMAYFGYLSWKRSVEDTKQAAMSEARDARLKSQVIAAANAHGAIIDWPARLAGSTHFRTSKVLTAELQDLWTTGKPVLFVGVVSDIARMDGDLVELSLDHAAVGEGARFSGTELRMKLTCKRSMADRLLAAASRPDRMGLFSDVAVVALVDSVEATSRRERDGDAKGVLTGIGTCLQVIPISESMNW